MNVGRTSKLTLECWVTPGQEQTIEEIVNLFGPRVIEVKEDMVLVGYFVQEVPSSQE